VIWRLLFVILLLAAAGGAGAQAPNAKPFKIGIITDAMVPWHESTEGFRDGLKKEGLVEGKDVIFDVRPTRGDPTRILAIYDELRTQKPDLLVCVADTCKKENGLIPMVFLQVDPLPRGLVRNIARPEGNITGVSDLRSEMTAKRLELFKELVPSLKRVLVSYDPREIGEVQSVASARSAATSLGLTLMAQPITDRFDIESALASLEQGGSDGILIVQAGTNLNIPGRSFEVAFAKKIPTMYMNTLWVEVGALATYGPDAYVQGRQAARMARKIVMGTPPGDIPVEQAERFVFSVNLKTAKQLGLSIPPQSLVSADRIIE
jgi:putative tryptophan/tyrosine transport system substrate-binding protein